MPTIATLKDTYGRPVTNLRISLTSRCNLSCIYCHAEGEKNPAAEMSAQEIIEIMNVAAKFGIRKHQVYRGRTPYTAGYSRYNPGGSQRDRVVHYDKRYPACRHG